MQIVAYEHQEFPKMVYPAGREPCVVESEAEEARVMSGAHPSNAYQAALDASRRVDPQMPAELKAVVQAAPVVAETREPSPVIVADPPKARGWPKGKPRKAASDATSTVAFS